LLLVVALVSALTTMRLAIHVREVKVPDLRNKTPAEAKRVAEENGISAQVDSNYYSAMVPEGRVLSQSPVAGTLVRRGWEDRPAIGKRDYDTAKCRIRSWESNYGAAGGRHAIRKHDV